MKACRFKTEQIWSYHYVHIMRSICYANYDYIIQDYYCCLFPLTNHIHKRLQKPKWWKPLQDVNTLSFLSRFSLSLFYVLPHSTDFSLAMSNKRQPSTHTHLLMPSNLKQLVCPKNNSLFLLVHAKNIAS